MIYCIHCGWAIEYVSEFGAWRHQDGRYFCWDTEQYTDPDYAEPKRNDLSFRLP